jgi:hypothetical protein
MARSGLVDVTTVEAPAGKGSALPARNADAGAVALGAIAPGSTPPFCLRVPQHRDCPDHPDAGLPIVWESLGQSSAGVGFGFGLGEVAEAVTELAVGDGPADLFGHVEIIYNRRRRHAGMPMKAAT